MKVSVWTALLGLWPVAGADVNAQDPTGATALHLSTARSVEIMEALLAAGTEGARRLEAAARAE